MTEHSAPSKSEIPSNAVDWNIFPLYTHVPGITPHPLSDADGHRLAGDAATSTRALECIHWPQLQQQFLTKFPASDIDTLQRHVGWRGCLLFDAGYYWEAHEAWEQVWIEAGRTGDCANFWKGLIKLAAAGVKVYEGNATGARRHLSRAIELLSPLASAPIPLAADSPTGWLSPSVPLTLAEHLSSHLPTPPASSNGTPVPALLGRLLG